MADVDSLILKDVVNRDVLTAYHNHMKSYVDKKVNGGSGTVSDQDIQTAITDIITELNK